jgi:dihydroneopterin aldolase
MSDQINCRGLKYSCSIGFHPQEQGICQELTIDLAARVPPIPLEHRDDTAQVALDYFQADQILARLLTARHFNLIETVAEVVAEEILERFPRVLAVTVTVGKQPIGMPRLESVAYVCERAR